MKLKSLTLLSNDLESQMSFYCETLGADLLCTTNNSFTVQIGWTILTFNKSNATSKYHYCFLIPSNKLDEALAWFNERIDTIQVDGMNTYFFESWNANSFYFYDGNGNVAECIVHYDLNNISTDDFNISQLLCINEIGMASNKIKELNSRLTNKMDSHFWKGDLERFAANGTREGLFLLVNNDIKKSWFPTDLPTDSTPFDALVETQKGLFILTFENAELSISKSEKPND